jgi:hypothetical protein
MARLHISILTVAALFLAACSSPVGAAAQTAALTPRGAPVDVAMADSENPGLAWAASVVQVDYLPNQNGAGAKLFGVAGGDPAMNGLYTYLAFYQNQAEGWRVFQLGDFLSYRVLYDAPGRVDLEIQESTMEASTGHIGSRTRHVIVGWTRSADGAPPMTISVTPAQRGD